MGELEALRAKIQEVRRKAEASRANMPTFIPDDKEVEYECLTCLDSGYNPKTSGQCECVAQKHIKTLFKSAAIPKRFEGKSLDNYDISRQPKAYQAAKDYSFFWATTKHLGRGLFLVGPVGTGKSHLAFGILQALLKQGVKGLAATVPDLMDELRPKEDKQGEKRMELLKTIEILVLDDLGAQRNTEWVTEQLFIILNARYSNMLPTVITSNAYLEDLEKIPGWKRIVDRIMEMCELVNVDGPSYRFDEATRRKMDKRCTEKLEQIEIGKE